MEKGVSLIRYICTCAVCSLLYTKHIYTISRAEWYLIFTPKLFIKQLPPPPSSSPDPAPSTLSHSSKSSASPHPPKQ